MTTTTVVDDHTDPAEEKVQATRHWWWDPWLWVIVAVGSVTRVLLLAQRMRYDEIITLEEFAVDFPTAISDYTVPNNHILHTVLVWGVKSTIGSEPWMIRLPAFAFGIGLIVAVYWWMRSAADRNTAIVSAALVAGSSLLIEYSVFARGYTLIAVAFVLLMELSRRMLDRPSKALWITWALLSIAGFITVPVFVFPFAGVVVWFAANLALRRGRADRKDTSIALVIALATVGLGTVVAYTPVIVGSGLDSLIDNPFVQSLAWSDLPRNWAGLVSGVRSFVFRDDFIAYLYPLFVLVAVILNRAIFGRFLTPALAMVGPVLVMLVRQVSPPQRVWLFAWPLGLALAAAGFVIATKRVFPRVVSLAWFFPAVAVAVAVWMGATTVESNEVTRSREGGVFRDAEAVAEVLADGLAPGDRVVVESHPHVILRYYLDELGVDRTVVSRDRTDADTLYVVVYGPRGQTLDRVLGEGRVDVERFTPPELLWEFPETEIYIMRRVS